MVDSSLRARPNPCPEDTVQPPDRPSAQTRTSKKNIHSLIDKVFSRQHLALAWERGKKPHGCAGIDHVTIEPCELRTV